MICLVSTAHGGMVQFSGSPTDYIEANGISVPIYSEARISLPGKHGLYTVKLTGAGLKRKKILFVTVNVYVVASYVYSSSGISATDPLGSLSKSNLELLYLTLVTDVKASQLRGAFEDALDLNGVDLEDPHFDNLLKRLVYDLAAETEVAIVAQTTTKGSLERVYLELPQETITDEASDFGMDFWRVWFGIPVDKEMGKLKKILMGL